MKVLAFAASLRKESWNHKLVALAAEIARRGGRGGGPRALRRVRHAALRW